MPKVKRLRKSLRIEADAEQVSAVIEDMTNAPQWNPAITSIALGEDHGKGLGSTVEWKADFDGRRPIPTVGITALIGPA
jgi:uncharacterized membrane protein